MNNNDNKNCNVQLSLDPSHFSQHKQSACFQYMFRPMLGLCQLKNFSIDKGQAWVETCIENKRFVCVVKSERERQLHVAVLIINDTLKGP